VPRLPQWPPAYCERALQLLIAGRRADGTSALTRCSDGAALSAHFFGQSSFATHAIVHQRGMVKVDPSVDLRLLGPLGCGLQTGAGAVLSLLRVFPGSSVAVFGAGAVGLSAVMAARIAGATAIVAVDLSPERPALASELGATHTVDAVNNDVGTELTAIKPGGFDFILEITANPTLLGKAVGLVKLGGTVCLIGGAPFGTRASIDMNELLAGRIVRGVVQGDGVPQNFIPELVELYKAGCFPIDKLVRFYDFTDINGAFDDARRGAAVKPILIIDEA